MTSGAEGTGRGPSAAPASNIALLHATNVLDDDTKLLSATAEACDYLGPLCLREGISDGTMQQAKPWSWATSVQGPWI